MDEGMGTAWDHHSPLSRAVCGVTPRVLQGKRARHRTWCEGSAGLPQKRWFHSEQVHREWVHSLQFWFLALLFWAKAKHHFWLISPELFPNCFSSELFGFGTSLKKLIVHPVLGFFSISWLQSSHSCALAAVTSKMEKYVPVLKSILASCSSKLLMGIIIIIIKLLWDFYSKEKQWSEESTRTCRLLFSTAA